jgi:hypothetical protein
LVNRSYPTDETLDKDQTTQWQRFEHHLSSLNTSSPANVQYKLLILGRHGQGFHNVAETKYGTVSWDVRTGLLYPNSTINLRRTTGLN